MHRLLLLSFLCLPCHAAFAAPQGDALRNYGVGTAGVTGMPALWATDAPRQPAGQPFALQLSRAGAFTGALPFVAFAPAQLTIAGLEVNLPPNAVFGLPLVFTDGAGRANCPMSIPTAPPLLGLDFFAQVFVNDGTSGAALPFTSTPGLQLRVAGAPLLFVAEVAASSHDTIDLTTGALSPVAAGSSYLAAYSRDGRRLFVQQASTTTGGRGLGLVRFFDSSSSPPVPLASPPTFTTAGVSVNRMVLTPDGSRLYVLNGNQPLFGNVEVLDADPASPGFGLPLHPPVPLPFKSPQDIAFTPDGRLAVVATNGLIEPLGLALLETDPTSPLFHQVIHGIPVPGGPILTALEMDPAGHFVYLGLNNLSFADIAVFDLATLAFIDFDPTTPEIDHLSALGVTIGSYLNDMVVHPRGGVLYCGGRDGVVRLDVDFGSAGFGSSVFVPLGPATLANVFAVAVSPAGDRVYAGEYRSRSVTEFHADTMAVLRTWTVAFPPEGFAIR